MEGHILIRWIVEKSIKFPLLAVALAFIIILIGYLQIQNMPIDALPEFAPPYIEVQTEAPGLPTSEIEELVTFNLEELLNGTAWLQSIRSISVPGLSAIRLYFQPGTDIIHARQLVSERLSLAYALPNVAQSPVILQPQSAMSRVMMLGLSSKTMSLIDMSELAYWNIRPILLSVSGVSNVAIWGLRIKQFQVIVDPAILQTNNLTLDQMISTTGNALWVSPLSFLNASTPGSGGWIETPQQRIEIRHILPIYSPQDLAEITIEKSRLTLGKVAKIAEGSPPLIGDDIVNNGNGLLIVINKFPNVNTLEVTREIEKKLNELKPSLTGMTLNKAIFRAADFVKKTTDHIMIAFGMSCALLLITIFLLIRSWQSVFICAITLFSSYALTICILNFFDISINMMVITGLMIAIAIITDEVIIDVEKNILERPFQNSTGSIAETLIAITLKNRNSMFFATLISLLMILPLFFLKGIASALIQPLVIAYAIAIIASVFVSWLITPALFFISHSKQTKQVEKISVLTSIRLCFQSYLIRSGKNLNNDQFTAFIIALSIASLVMIFALLPFKNLPLFPTFKEQNILVQCEAPPGTSLGEMVRITSRMSHEIQSIPGVHDVAVHIGRAVLGDKIINVNTAELTININSEANYQKTIAVIQHVVSGYPGLYHTVQSYLKDRIQQIFTETSNDIVVRIFGHDFNILQDNAIKIKNTLSNIQGIDTIYVDQQIQQPEISITVDLPKAQQYGLKPGDVRRAAATLVAGLQVGSLFDEQKIFPVIVWGDPKISHSLNSLQNILIDTPNGKSVRLDQVANASIIPSFAAIQHQTVSRNIDVRINVKGRRISAVENDVNQALKNIQLPLEYHMEILGMYQLQQSTIQNIIIISIILLVIIFLLMQAIFDNFALAALIFFSLPAALIGGLLTAIMMGCSSLIPLAGLLAIYSIAVRNTIMSITQYQLINRDDPTAFFSIAGQRCIAIFVTTCAIIAAFLPFLILFAKPGLEIAAPTGAIMIGGMITAFIYCAFVVPMLYFGFDKTLQQDLNQGGK